MSTLTAEQKPHQLEQPPPPLVVAKNVGVKYEGEVKKQDFKSIAHKYMLGQWRHKKEDFWALQGVSFSAYPGDILGIIGSNGAGKTTLCRVLSGLLLPDTGSIMISGAVSALLSLGTGFNSNLSGRENVFLNGMMLGFSRKHIKELYPQIREFAGIGDFIDQPVKVYSSGMKSRLGFSIAATLEADILVIDEVLGSGDLEFSQKASAKMRSLVEQANLVIVVSHNLGFIEENCNRALWIEKGELQAEGDPAEVTTSYKELKAAKPKKKKIVNLKETRTEVGTRQCLDVSNLGLYYNIDKKPFWALKNVNFSVCNREIVGIIGRNGAGKTTLCRALCGILKEDEGKVLSHGEVAALLSFGLGFSSKLTGRDNIYLNGMMLGLTRQFIRLKQAEIIEFSGLEKHIEKPVKNYSSGMKSRLGFSIASILQPDILVIDEALSAGDAAFQEKATERMQDMLEDAGTVVVVTHSLNIVETVCTRALLVDKGGVVFDGDPKEAVKIYKQSVKKK